MTFALRRHHEAAWANHAAVEQGLREGRTRLDARPPHVRLDLTTRCNLRCVQCRVTESRTAHRDMAPAVLERIEREVLPSAAAVVLADEGEPLLYPDLDHALGALGRLRPPYSCVFTSGQLLDESLGRRLIEAGLQDLAVSIDGARAATYEAVRRGASFEKLVVNLARLRDLKRELGVSHPIVTVHTVVMLDNLPELADIVRLAHGLGAAEVLFYGLVCFTSEMTAHSAAGRPEETRARLGEAVGAGLDLGLPVRLSPELPVPPPPPREAIDGRFYAGALTLESITASAPPGGEAVVRLTVQNDSPFTWYCSRTPSSESCVSLSHHVYDAQGALLEWDGPRTALPSLAPGQRATVEARVALPARAGELRLGFDLVNEGRRWFGLEQPARITLASDAATVPAEAILIEATSTETGRCEHPWRYAALKVGGDVFPCRFLSLPMGNLRECSFEEVWNSERYQRLRASILDGSYSICLGATCGRVPGPPGALRSEIELLAAPANVAAGDRGRFRLAVTNLGRVTWNAAPGSGDPTHFALTYSLFNEDGSLRPAEPSLTELPHDLPPGLRVELEADVQLPRQPGRYTVAFEMVRRYVVWFSVIGNPPCRVPVRVEPPRPGTA